eukprot:7956852-Alexandrium_andersonii.AAC.1
MLTAAPEYAVCRADALPGRGCGRSAPSGGPEPPNPASGPSATPPGIGRSAGSVHSPRGVAGSP